MREDWIADNLRGFDQVCLDIYRIPEKVEAACNALLPYAILLAKASAGERTYKTGRWPPLFIPLHIGPFLSPKQFEEFYWPTFKKLVERLAELGYLMWIFFESDWTRYLEYLSELPRGKIIGCFEFTDLVKAKAMISDRICIAGNLPVSLLAIGTPNIVRELCKKLIDEIGEGGGYIMSTGQVLSSNVKTANLRVMTEFTKKYGVYK